MKSKFSLLLILLAVFVSCKQEKTDTPTEETNTTTAAPAATNEITLSNYSDENWKNGVGITFKMFLADNTPSNLELIKKGKELELASGVKVPYVGFEEKGGFIQIFITEKPEKYASAAEFPNKIKVN